MSIDKTTGRFLISQIIERGIDLSASGLFDRKYIFYKNRNYIVGKFSPPGFIDETQYECDFSVLATDILLFMGNMGLDDNVYSSFIDQLEGETTITVIIERKSKKIHILTDQSWLYAIVIDGNKIKKWLMPNTIKELIEEADLFSEISQLRHESVGACLGRVRWAKLEGIILANEDYHAAYQYALEVVGGRWIEAEDLIRKYAPYVGAYARNVLNHRWTEFEDTLLSADSENELVSYMIQFKINDWKEAVAFLTNLDGGQYYINKLIKAGLVSAK